MGLGTFNLPIMDTDADAPYVYVPPADWIDITTVGNNEINLLTSDLSDATLAFSVTTASGTYSIDWGDGTVETGRVSGTTYQHTFTTGGTACSRGYNTWKVRIYGASGNITGFNVKSHNLQTRQKYNPLLRAVFGTTGLSSIANMFSESTGNTYCFYLENVVFPSTLNSVTTSMNAFTYCIGLLSVTMPNEMNIWTGGSATFQNCYKLQELIFPTTLNSFTTFTSFFNNCYNLKRVVLPTSMNALQGLGSTFANCYSLKGAIFPSNITTITSLASTFSSCFRIKKIVLPTTLNSCTDLSSTFNNCYTLKELTFPTSLNVCDTLSGTFTNCYKLTSITLPTTMNSVTTVATCFQSNISLESVTLPTSMSACTNYSSMFTGCNLLKSVTLPTTISVSITTFASMFNNCFNLESVVGFSGKTLNGVTTCSSMFANCYKLPTVDLWSSSTGLTNTSSMFAGCGMLKTITLPNMLAVTTASSMFSACYSLDTINNLGNLGSTSFIDLSTAFDGCQKMISISIGSNTSKISVAGSSGFVQWLNSFRLTYASKGFSGTSPQINASYTSLDQTALETLFDDITNGLASKTIAITGAVGNVGFITKTNCGTTVNSNVITQSNTTNLQVGMEVTGTGINTARSVTFTDAGDLVGLTAHGLLNGVMVGFTAITSTTGIAINTKYYVVNRTADTFQVSATLGGAALPLTTNGTGTIMFVPTIQSITTNVSFTIDANCSATSSVITGSFALLARRKATTKGWTVTN